MRAIMDAHDEELRRVERNLEAEKEQHLNNLMERLRKKREEREAALLKKQQKEVYYSYLYYLTTLYFPNIQIDQLFSGVVFNIPNCG